MSMSRMPNKFSTLLVTEFANLIALLLLQKVMIRIHTNPWTLNLENFFHFTLTSCVMWFVPT